MIKRNRLYFLLLPLLSATVLWSAGFVAPQRTQALSAKKVSTDILGITDGTRVVDAIIQTNGSWSTALDTDIKSRGGVVKQKFKNMNAGVVTMKVKDAIAEAARTDVKYVSLNRQTRATGHVSLTSGGPAARAMSTNGIPYDGTGIGIAIIDSGMDLNHVAFQDAHSKSRIAYSQDFTGETDLNGLPITSDPYGHGTHV